MIRMGCILESYSKFHSYHEIPIESNWIKNQPGMAMAHSLLVFGFSVELEAQNHTTPHIFFTGVLNQGDFGEL